MKSRRYGQRSPPKPHGFQLLTPPWKYDASLHQQTKGCFQLPEVWEKSHPWLFTRVAVCVRHNRNDYTCSLLQYSTQNSLIWLLFWRIAGELKSATTKRARRVWVNACKYTGMRVFPARTKTYFLQNESQMNIVTTDWHCHVLLT